MPAYTLRVKLTPRADRNALVRYEAGLLHARVTAAPVEGAANEALVGLLAGALGIRKSAIILASGLSSREKRVEVEGLLPGELELRIEAALQKGRS
jgi:uncharacterized protein